MNQELGATGRIASQYKRVLRRRRQAVLVEGMEELKNETPSTGEVSKLGGLDWVCKRYRIFVGRECISAPLSQRKLREGRAAV
jgi:hypothetical protein